MIIPISGLNTEIYFERAEAATGSVLLKKVFLKISQTSQENTCVWGLGRQLYYKRGSSTGASCEFYKFFKNTFVTEHLPANEFCIREHGKIRTRKTPKIYQTLFT